MKEGFIVGIMGALAIAALIVVFAIAGTVFGAIGGWIVGWVFDETSLKWLVKVGLADMEMWEVGAFLGFVGSFLKSTNTNNCK